MSDRLIPILPCAAMLLAGLTAFTTPAHTGQPACKPTLVVENVQFSKWKPPSQERKWSATVMVDASRCAPNASGYFDIGFLRAKEYSPDLEFREQFVWMAPSVKVGVDFWFDEAVETFWIENVAPCMCAE